MRWLRPASILAALLAFGVATEVRGQSNSLNASDRAALTRPSLTLSAGAFQYDRAGPGTAPVLAARGELPLSRVFLVEGGLAAARPEARRAGLTSLVVPEASG